MSERDDYMRRQAAHHDMIATRDRSHSIMRDAPRSWDWDYADLWRRLQQAEERVGAWRSRCCWERGEVERLQTENANLRARLAALTPKD